MIHLYISINKSHIALCITQAQAMLIMPMKPTLAFRTTAFTSSELRQSSEPGARKGVGHTGNGCQDVGVLIKKVGRGRNWEK